MTITCDSCRSEPDNRYNSQGFADRELSGIEALYLMPHMSVISWCSDSVTLRSKDQESSVQGVVLGDRSNMVQESNDCNDFLGRGKVCDRFWHHLGQHLLIHRVHRVHCPTRPSLPIPLRWPSGHEAARPPHVTCVNMSRQDAQGIDARYRMMQNDTEWCRMMQLHSMQKRTAIEQQNIFFRIEENQHIVTAFQCWEQHQWGMREVVPGIQRIWVQIALWCQIRKQPVDQIATGKKGNFIHNIRR